MIISLLVLVPYGQALAWTDDGGARGPGPFAAGDPWSDTLDDMSHVYVPQGGLRNVEVSGGEVRLSPGHDEGWVASTPISVPDGYRYDLVLLDVVTPGNSYVNITILDPSQAPSSSAFANATVPAFVNMTGTDESVFRVAYRNYPEIRIQVTLVANGTDRPRLLGWSLHFIPLGEWRDDFLGTGKMVAMDGINVTSSTIEVDLSDTSGGAHDPFPPVLFPDSRGDVDVFLPTASSDGYQNGATIANTAGISGIDSDDLDDDGYPDVILTGGGNIQSMILWGSSSGTWSTSDKTSLSHRDSGTDAAVGDFNGDGHKDIVISAVGGMIHDGSYVYLNNGDGTFDKDWDIKLDGGTGSVDAGDLNNDGYDDIVLTKSLVMDAPCYFGSSTGPDNTADLNFLRGIVMTAINEVLIDDVDQDGYLDVLFAVVDQRKAPVYIGGATGPDVNADYKLLLKGIPTDVSVGDVNGDGYMDIAYVTGDSAGGRMQIEIFKGTSSGWDDNTKHTISDGRIPVELVDIDVDGYEDVVTTDAANFKVYYGGSTWPTAVDITKAGLTSPGDMTVAMVGGGGGGAYRGSIVTDPIPLPGGKEWDILHLEGNLPENTSFSITVLDTVKDPIPGYEDLTHWTVDLSDIQNWREIYIKVDLFSATNETTPVLESLLVNWLDEMSWRDQFYGDVKTESSLGIGSSDLMLKDTDPWASGRDSFLFASLRGDAGYNTRSVAFLDAGDRDYTILEPVYFNTKGAMAISALDINGDHFEDLVFASYGTSDVSFTGTSPLFLGSPAGWYDVPYHSFPTTGARDVVMKDLNLDGYADVVFAQERNAQGPFVKSILFWGSASGWNSTPDLEFSTTGASGVVTADLNNDDRDDLVFACYEGADYATDSMAFLQESAGFCGTIPSIKLPTVGARAVAAANLNTDGYIDLVFANSYDGDTYALNSYIYWNEHGSGGTFDPIPTELPTIGAMDVEIADYNGNPGDIMDLIFANGRNATAGYNTESYYYENDGGTFASSPDIRIPTEGAYAMASFGSSAKEPVFACRNNGTTYRIPSVAMVWPSFQTPIEFPTIGATDVLPFKLNGASVGGYLSQAITPDAEDDIGGFHTLRYSATLDNYQAGMISIIDAVTGIKLAEAPIAEGDQEWDLRGLFSYREHPSIRVLINVWNLSHLTGFALDDLWLNWTKRIMEAPVVVDLGLEETTVLRTETIRLWINATDEYDAPDGLTVLVEHQLDGETTWKTSMLGSLSFSDGLWWRDVTPDRYQTPGVYSFRVNVTDSDREASGYVDFPSSLEVLPNLLGAPRLLLATASAASVELEWRSPLDMGDLPVVGYRVLRGTSEGDLSVIDTVDQFAEGYTDTGLVNGLTYYYAIVAYNDLGDSPWSDVLNATPIDVPGPPQGLTVESGDGTVSLTWEPPLLDGGTPLLGYRILRGDAADSLIEIADIGDEGAFTDEALTNGVTYYYSVLAYNNVGAGPRTEPVAATPLGLPGAPDGVTSEVGTLGITLRWQAPGDTGEGDIIGFIIYRGLADDALEVEESLSGSTTQFLDDDVTAGTTYYYAIAAETAAGEGPMSSVVEVAALGHPGMPKDLSAEAGDGKVTLEWLAPDSDGGSPITGYVVLRGASPSSLEDLAELSDVLSYVDTTAVNGETYHYAVIAVNALGRSIATDAVEATPFEPTYVPGKVTAFAAEVKGTKAVLAWAAPADDGGSPITGYVILRGETRDTMVEIDRVGVVLTYTDEDLERGRTYYYSVRAVNDVGQGDAFDPQSVKVEKEEGDDGGFPIAILIAVAAIIVIVVATRFMRPGRKDEGEQEALQEDLQGDREEVPEEEGSDGEGSDEEGPREEIVIEHREV